MSGSAHFATRSEKHLTEQRCKFLLIRSGAVVEHGGDVAGGFQRLEKDLLRVTGWKLNLAQRNHHWVVGLDD